jgi:hypothetical protein
MEKQKKIYCGSGKKKNDTWFQVSLNPEKFNEYIREYNGNRFIRLNINVLPQPDKFGKDISVSIDTWEPDASKQSFTKTESYPAANKPVENFDLPF